MSKWNHVPTNFRGWARSGTPRMTRNAIGYKDPLRAERKYQAAQERQWKKFLRTPAGKEWLRQQQQAQVRQLEQYRLQMEKLEQERKLKEQQQKEWQTKINDWHDNTAAGRLHRKQSDTATSVGCGVIILAILTIIFLFINLFIGTALAIITLFTIIGWVHNRNKIPELPLNLKYPQ